MPDIQITCVSRSDSAKTAKFRGHENITHVGSPAGRWTCAEVIARIDQSTDAFWLLSPSGNRIAIRVVDLGLKIKLLRSFSNDDWTDHLLHLPSC